MALNAEFGVYATYDYISQHTGLSEDELGKWSYYRFYSKVGYLSKTNAYKKRLREAYNRK